MTCVYEKLKKSLGNAHSAWIITLGSVKVGRIIVVGKTAYVHYMGQQMRFGIATGGGYDLTGAAISIAARKSEKIRVDNDNNDPNWAEFNRLLSNADSGTNWEHEMVKAGFTVHTVF